MDRDDTLVSDCCLVARTLVLGQWHFDDANYCYYYYHILYNG
jgi:hypothetical protein